MANYYTGECLFSFVNLLEPEERNGKPQYAVTLLTPVGSDTHKMCIEAVRAELENEYDEEIDDNAMAEFQHPVNLVADINRRRLRKNPEARIWKGYDDDMVAIKFTKPRSKDPSKHKFFTPPGIVGPDTHPIPDLNHDDIYSGMYGIVYFHSYFYSGVDFDPGVGFGLDHVMKTRDGDKLAAGSDPTQVFAKYAKQEDASGETAADRRSRRRSKDEDSADRRTERRERRKRRSEA